MHNIRYATDTSTAQPQHSAGNPPCTILSQD